MSSPASSPADEPPIQAPGAIFQRFLKRQGLKFTSERAKILDAVLAKEGVFEADALLYEMRQSGQRVSKATIYRTLKHLLDADIISEVLIDAKQAHYRLSIGRSVTSHLVCLETNQIVEVATPELTSVAERICREHGFQPENYRFVIYGVSAEAKADDAESSR